MGAEAIVEARYDGYDDILLTRVAGPLPLPDLPEGLSSDRSLYHLERNKEKAIILSLNSWRPFH